MKRLGVLLASGPDEGDFPLVEAAVQAALAAGAEAAVFLMDAGVAYARDPRLRALCDAGLEVTVCASDALAAGLTEPELQSAGVRLGSQRDHGRLLRRSDRFLAFT